MAELPLHPKIVHLPIALAVIMPLLSTGILLLWWRGLFPRSVWGIVLALQVLLVGSGWLAMEEGEEEEERVEKVVSHDLIHEHEEAAEAFVYAAGALLVPMGAALFVPPANVALALAAVSAIGSMGVVGLVVEAGETGGGLVYTHGAASVYQERVVPGSGGRVIPRLAVPADPDRGADGVEDQDAPADEGYDD